MGLKRPGLSAKPPEPALIMAMGSKPASEMSKSKRAVMKAKRVSKIARGRLAKALVLRGKFEKTRSGLRAEGLMKNKRGKVVSKRASAARARSSKDWIDALMKARGALNLSGFVAINGKSAQGKALYLKAKTAYDEQRSARTQGPAVVWVVCSVQTYRYT